MKISLWPNDCLHGPYLQYQHSPLHSLFSDILLSKLTKISAVATILGAPIAEAQLNRTRRGAALGITQKTPAEFLMQIWGFHQL